MSKNANIMLVHGAWADGSCWSKVILLLQAKGFTVTSAQIPLTSLDRRHRCHSPPTFGADRSPPSWSGTRTVAP